LVCTLAGRGWALAWMHSRACEAAIWLAWSTENPTPWPISPLSTAAPQMTECRFNQRTYIGQLRGGSCGDQDRFATRTTRSGDQTASSMISGVVVLEVQESIRVFALDWFGETVVMDVLYGSPGGISLGSAFGKTSPSADRRSTDCGSSKKNRSSIRSTGSHLAVAWCAI